MGGAELPTTVDLCWIPLGAGRHVVRLSGKLFEAVSGRVQTRSPCDLYHSALVVVVPEGRFVIEQTPVIDGQGDLRGVVLEGPVGTRLAGRFRLFRYEVRRWRDGVIPDVAEAVSTVRVADDPVIIGRILDLVPSVPPLVWGRDHGRTGDMWNSNSVISWLLARAGVDAAGISPPPRGRAPGWHAGIVIAARDAVSAPVRSSARVGSRVGWFREPTRRRSSSSPMVGAGLATSRAPPGGARTDADSSSRRNVVAKRAAGAPAITE
jgi:hypothetical protein